MSNSPYFDLSAQTAVVTGASRGLGQTFAMALARSGADIVITSRDRDDLQEFSKQIESLGRRCWPVELDIRDNESIRRCFETIDAEAGSFQILVNNAGCNIRKPALEVTPEDWDTVVGTNLKGSFFVAQAAGRRMVSSGYGRIINIGSVTSVFGYAGIAPYCASRGGIKQLTMALADEWGPHGVTVNCLAPGWFKTAQNAVLYEDQEWVTYLEDRIPVKRVGRQEDLEGAVVFLASRESSYVTGQTLLIDGGITTGATRATLKRPSQK